MSRARASGCQEIWVPVLVVSQAHLICDRGQVTAPLWASVSSFDKYEVRGRIMRSMEKAMAPHCSTPAWKIPGREEPGGLQSMGSLESDTTEWLRFHFSLSRIGEGNGNPIQCSCLENPRDGGAWWAAISGVAQSWTRLRWLSLV